MKIKNALIKKVNAMTANDLKKFQKVADQEDIPGVSETPTSESESDLQTKLALAEEKLRNAQAEVESLNAQIAQLKSSDVKVQAVQRALPQDDIKDMSVDQIYHLYDTLQKNGYIKDTIASTQDQVNKIHKRYHLLCEKELFRTQDALIKVTRNSRNPYTISSVSKFIEDLKTQGIIDVYDITVSLQKELMKAISYQPQETADEAITGFGLPLFASQENRDRKPYQPMNAYLKATGQKVKEET